MTEQKYYIFSMPINCSLKGVDHVSVRVMIWNSDSRLDKWFISFGEFFEKLLILWLYILILLEKLQSVWLPLMIEIYSFSTKYLFFCGVRQS